MSGGGATELASLNGSGVPPYHTFTVYNTNTVNDIKEAFCVTRYNTDKSTSKYKLYGEHNYSLVSFYGGSLSGTVVNKY